MLVGAGGKMGPTLALMAAEVLRDLGTGRRVRAVSRFSDPRARALLEAGGVETIACDLLDRPAVAALPDAENVLFLAGQKFGTSEGPERTWAMNTIVPDIVAERFAASRIVAFSTGCVYSFASVFSGGSREDAPTSPAGDYANSCLGRERIFQFASRTRRTRVCLFRLNYAIDFRYGVLLDVAQRVRRGEAIDLTTGFANVIWQGDANARALQCLELADTPALAVNVTGPETLSIREIAEDFGRRFGVQPQFTGTEAPTAWLSNAGRSFQLFGYPTVSVDQMIDWTEAWIHAGADTLGKPTHFETRDGSF